ncbi:hypothetical protein ACFORL_07055 [Legionella dresdenensis]|uniref:Uncharacterized protein n=1 Tax=Legionella dresdenensis TaxID=450200 RepID=A0ABV8CEV1_9GAMM
MEVTEGSHSTQYRYKIIAQKFVLPNGKCLLAIRDQQDNIIMHISPGLAFRNNEMLSDMSPQDIKLVGYIYASEHVNTP